jgi:RNA polymerase sigma-70 factor (ECF subfamily)
MRSVERAAASPLFCTTSWTMVLACGDQGHSPDARAALASLYQAYWYPLYAYLRHRGYSQHDAEDLVQSFYAFLQEKHALTKADRARGKFRTFLLSSLQNFVSHEHERARAQKRGGGREPIFLDALEAHERYRLEPAHGETPESVFEQRWAQTLLEQTLAGLRADFTTRGKQRLFEGLRPFLTSDAAETSYQAAADQLGLPLSAVKTSIRRMRLDYRARLREEIGRTVESPDEVDDELRYLRKVLAA